KTMPVEEFLAIDIKPGWKRGTKLTFPEKGSEQPGRIAADLIFIIDEKPHKTFTREGNDLVVTQKISLAEALTGYTMANISIRYNYFQSSVANFMDSVASSPRFGTGVGINRRNFARRLTYGSSL
ncbi:hypothetical protein CRG98_048174, partial [Punica granatum]